MRKTVLILHHVSGLGGGTNSLIDMALMLKDKYRAIICVPDGSEEMCKLAEKFEIEAYEVKTPIPSFNLYSGMPGYFNRYFWSRILRFRKNKQLVAELMQLHPNAVFFNTSVTALIAKDLPQTVKKVCIVRETFIPSPLNRIIWNNFERRFDGVAYIAQHEMDYIHITRPLQIVVPDCLEPAAITIYDRAEMRREYGIPCDCFCALFMGGLDRIKGLDVMLKAAERLDESFKVIVAGKIDMRRFSWKFLVMHLYHFSLVRYLLSVRKRLKRLTKAGKVIQTGYILDIAPYMSMCDTVVFPSTAAHQPRPCIEAGNFERSCVLSDFDATKEFFKDGYNALTFQPGNDRDLAEKLRFLHENPEINVQLAANNRKMSRKKHDFAATQKKLAGFFETILEDG